MPALNRMSGPRGPRFYDQDGETMFLLVLDSSTRVGPRPAEKEDAEANPAAWADYAQRRKVEADHDDAVKAALKAGEGVPLEPPGEFPGRPVIEAKDPPGGPPPALPSRRKAGKMMGDAA